MTNAAIYTRVSTAGQFGANQLDETRAVAAARGWTIVTEYADVASGARAPRPAWKQLVDDARRAKWARLVVWSVDRIGRHLAENLARVQELDRLGIGLVSCREGWLDTTGPTRDLLLAIVSWVAQYERDRIGERTRAGLARARADGVRLGRPTVSRVKLDAAACAVLAGETIDAAAESHEIGRSTLVRRLAELRRPAKGSALELDDETRAAVLARGPRVPGNGG